MEAPKFVIDHILPVGLTLFTGKPKTGVSWLALEYAYAVAFGGTALGRYRAQIQGGVLYISTSAAVLQDRLHCTQDAPPPPQRMIFSPPPSKRLRFDQWLRDMLALQPHVRLVIVDTVADILPDLPRDTFTYHTERAFADGLHRVCDDSNVSLLLLHRSRSDGTGVNGLGLGSGCDCVASLDRYPPHPRRGRNGTEGALRITGRRVTARQIDLAWDAACTCWRIAEDVEGAA